MQYSTKVLIFTNFAVIYMFASCSNAVSTEIPQDLPKEFRSPLDTILGDKILNLEQLEFRENNFQHLLGKSKYEFYVKSDLYNIQFMNSDFVLLKQRKKYLEARNFEILLKFRKSQVINYFVFNDYYVSDIKQDGDNWLVLLSDFDQPNLYWKRGNQIRVLNVDSTLNELWTYDIKCSYLLNGDHLQIDDQNIVVFVQVITGCHICYTLTEWIFNRRGELQKIRFVESFGGSHLEIDELREQFLK